MKEESCRLAGRAIRATSIIRCAETDPRKNFAVLIVQIPSIDLSQR
jgi:hypothetical protein